MTKIVNLDKKSGITRSFVSNFGEYLYHKSAVKRVIIKIDFKDGSSISFKKDEDNDDFEELFKEE